MAKTIPNSPATGTVIPSGLYSADFAGLVGGHAGDGVLSGLGVSPQGSPTMNVDLAAGLMRCQGYFAYVAAQTVSIPAAPTAPSNRWHLIVADYNGTVSRVDGSAAEVPVLPDIPANSISLAKIYVPGGATAISNAGDDKMVHDDRVVVPDYYDVYADFLGSSLSNTAATSAGSIGECGWTLSGTTAAPTFQAATAGHPGVLRSASGTTSGNNCRFHFGSAANTAVFLPSQIGRLMFLLSIPTITTGAWKAGLGVDLSVATAGDLGTAGAWVEFVPATSAKWRFCTRQASTTTVNPDTGADVAAATWYQFDLIRKQNGNWQFLKNGALAFEHSTNLPTTAGNVGTLTHTLTAAARNMDHDAFGLNLAPLGNRWT